MELEQFNLKLEWIQGAKNTLADSLSRLLEVDPEAKLQPEREGHEFGTFCFEELNETGEISPDCWTPAIDSVEHMEITYDKQNVREVKLPLKTEQMIQLQKKDPEARNIYLASSTTSSRPCRYIVPHYVHFGCVPRQVGDPSVPRE